MTRICTLTKCNRNESSIIQYMPVLFFYNILTYLGVCELEFPGNVIAKRPFLYQLNKNDTIQARSLGRPVMMALHLITNKQSTSYTVTTSYLKENASTTFIQSILLQLDFKTCFRRAIQSQDFLLPFRPPPLSSASLQQQTLVPRPSAKSLQTCQGLGLVLLCRLWAGNNPVSKPIATKCQ